MKPSTKTAIAQLLAAAGSVLSAFADEFNGEEQATSGPIEGHQKLGGTPVDSPTMKRGRKAAATVPAQEPAPTETAQPESPAEPEVVGKTYEELRALIKPLVEGGQGAEVKQVIQKYAASLKEIQPKDHAAFEKDIAALSY